MKKYNLILGSQSPRRKELLQWSFLPYKIITSDIEEVSSKKNVEEFVMDIANQKALAVYQMTKEGLADSFVIGADTIVVCENRILGKPKDLSEAKEMLLSLSGKKHMVYTGVSFVWGDKTHLFFEKTEVEFDIISEHLLNHYLHTNESLDKAGAYGIQGAALGFIRNINGCYANVVGLPINKVINELSGILAKEGLKIEEAFNE